MQSRVTPSLTPRVSVAGPSERYEGPSGGDRDLVVIIGASSGDGLDLARAFSLAGATLLLVDNDAQRLARVANLFGAASVVCDPSDDAAIATLADTLARDEQSVGLLVNAYGSGGTRTHAAKLACTAMLSLLAAARAPGLVVNVDNFDSFEPDAGMGRRAFLAMHRAASRHALRFSVRSQRVVSRHLRDGDFDRLAVNLMSRDRAA